MKIKKNRIRKYCKPNVFEINLATQPGAKEMIELMKRLEQSGIKIAEQCVLTGDKAYIVLAKSRSVKGIDVFPKVVNKGRELESKKNLGR